MSWVVGAHGWLFFMQKFRDYSSYLRTVTFREAGWNFSEDPGALAPDYLELSHPADL